MESGTSCPAGLGLLSCRPRAVLLHRAVATRRQQPPAAAGLQGGNLDNGGPEPVESSQVVAGCHDSLQPNKISSRRSSTAEHRFCKPVVGGPNPPAGSMERHFRFWIFDFRSGRGTPRLLGMAGRGAARRQGRPAAEVRVAAVQSKIQNPKSKMPLAWSGSRAAKGGRL